MDTTRESLILQFNTDLNRVRSMSLPNPNPGLDSLDIREGAGLIIAAEPFDHTGSSSGVLVDLYRAMLERVTTIVLI